MPRSTLDKARSPERIPYHQRHKPATPIEIPRRAIHASSALSSPEMLFEMSPVSSSFPPTALSTISVSPGPSLDENQPFLYSIPVFNRLPNAHKKSCSRQRSSPRSTASVHPFGAPLSPLPIQADPLKEPHPDTQEINIFRSHSTTKITGFTPINDQPTSADLLPQIMGRLSPPPRRSSFSLSPWILPGRSDREEDSPSYSHVDPSAFEFQRHLLRRIENKDSSRFASLRSCL